MQQKLEKLFGNLEKSRQELLSLTDGYTQAQLNFKPGTDEWSMVQVIKHLVITETQILQYIQRKLAQENLPDATYKSWLRYMLVKLALRYRKKIKAPKQVAAPPSELNLPEVIAEWDQLRRQWKETLRLMPLETTRKDIFRHPLAGKMSIHHTLGFMNEHVRHHMAQINRIRQAKNWK